MAAPVTPAPVRRAPDRFADVVWAATVALGVIEILALFWLDVF